MLNSELWTSCFKPLNFSGKNRQRYKLNKPAGRQLAALIWYTDQNSLWHVTFLKDKLPTAINILFTISGSAETLSAVV